MKMISSTARFPMLAISVSWVAVSIAPSAFGCRVPRIAAEVRQLQDQEYIELPQGLCPGYSDTLVGTTSTHEYGGVVCDRTEGSYLFLQRLVGYTPEKKAIWKVIEIKALSQLRANERVVSAGCKYTQDDEQPLFAVVDTTTTSPYKTQQAWVVNLVEERFVPIAPALAVCQDPLI